jgi:hypothetical protein
MHAGDWHYKKLTYAATATHIAATITLAADTATGDISNIRRQHLHPPQRPSHCSLPIYTHQSRHCTADAVPAYYATTPDAAFPKHTLRSMRPLFITRATFLIYYLFFHFMTFVPTSVQRRYIIILFLFV